MILGQLAIVLHLAPTIIEAPTVLGVAGLGLVGALMVIVLLGHATAAREMLESELRGSERRLSALVTSSSDIVLVATAGGELSYASPAFESVLGYPSGDAHSLMADTLLHADDREGLATAMAAAGTSGSTVSEEIRFRRSDGEWLWFEAAITNLTDDPDVNGYVANLRDITRRKDAEDRLAHAALHDSLTGLPNRALILNRAEQMLARSRRELRTGGCALPRPRRFQGHQRHLGSRGRRPTPDGRGRQDGERPSSGGHGGPVGRRRVRRVGRGCLAGRRVRRGGAAHQRRTGGSLRDPGQRCPVGRDGQYRHRRRRPGASRGAAA